MHNFHSGDSGNHISENRAINYFVQKTTVLLLQFFNFFKWAVCTHYVT